MTNHWKNIVAIAVGGAIGTYGRYSLNIITSDSIYPVETLLENLIGSFLLGFLTAWFIVLIPREWVKVGLGVGLCGGFTTMSTFAADTFTLFVKSSLVEVLIYIGGSVLGGMLLALCGYLIASNIATKVKDQRKEVNAK
ncbi:fluoride efflux transporter FluC [Gracilibacillus massiliensis]|uniref:fluoride efflux transporter FluC n=1 Tax=Gracilibacillus massiliensis TaxID=1564956 RepID=UPI00071DBE0A|nr:CrcB family protein [Gracilibacillus massiliensis]